MLRVYSKFLFRTKRSYPLRQRKKSLPKHQITIYHLLFFLFNQLPQYIFLEARPSQPEILHPALLDSARTELLLRLLSTVTIADIASIK